MPQGNQEGGQLSSISEWLGGKHQGQARRAAIFNLETAGGGILVTGRVLLVAVAATLKQRTRKARPGMWARRLAGLHPKLPCISVFATSLVFVVAPVCPLCLLEAWRSKAHWNSEVLFGQVGFTSIQWLPLQWSASTTKPLLPE